MVASQSGSPRRGRLRRWWRPVLAVVGIAVRGLLLLRLATGARDRREAELAACRGRDHGCRRPAGRRGVRRPQRPATADVGMPYAWSTAATLEPWPEGKTFFPKILADVEAAQLVGAHPDVRLAGRRDRHRAQRPADREDEGGRRGARDRRRTGKSGVRAGRPDVHAPRRRRRADRRQRPPALGRGRPLPRPPHLRLEPGRGRPRRPPQALRDRRHGRLDGRRRDRGPLRERQVPRRHGSRHRERRPPGAGAVPDELPRPRRAAAERPLRSTSPPSLSRGRSRSRSCRPSPAASSRRPRQRES